MHFTTLQKEASSFDRVTMDPSLSCIWREIQFRPQRKEAVQFYFERQRVCSFQLETVFVMMLYHKITMGRPGSTVSDNLAITHNKQLTC